MITIKAMSLMVTFRDDSAPSIGGIAADASSIGRVAAELGARPDLAPFVAWIENYGAPGENGDGAYLVPELVGPGTPETVAAGVERIAAVAAAWHWFRTEHPGATEGFRRWDEILAWAADHGETPYICGS